MSDLLTQNINLALQNALIASLSKLNINVPAALLKQIIQTASSEVTPKLTGDVSTSTNQLIDSIPKQLIGVKNPVDLISSNLGSKGVADNLNNTIVNAIAPKSTSALSSNIIRLLRQQLPAPLTAQINFNQLQTILNTAIEPDVESAVTDTLSGVVDGIFNAGTAPLDTLFNLENFNAFSSVTDIEYPEDLDSVLEQVDLNHSTGLVAESLKQSEQFDIKSTENEEKLRVLEQGFTDPNANYPTNEYAGRSEVNKLATEDVNSTIVQKKDRERMIGAKLPGGEAWDQPPSAYRSRYPFNKVTQTESGHIIEVDDTPGSERLHIYHRSGTFVEIDANGSIIKRSTGSSYEIIDRNGKIAVSGKADISVNGACNIYVGNDANIEVDGDTNIICHNDITAQAGGTFNLSAVEEFNITSEYVNIEAYKDCNIKTGEKYYVYSGQDMHVLTDGNLKTQVSKSSYFKTGEDYFNQISGELHYKIGGDSFCSANNINYEASGDFNIDSTTMYMNSGTASPAQNSQDSTKAGPSNIGIITGRKDIIRVDIEDPVALNLGDNFKLAAEEETASEEEINAQKDKVVLSGILSREDYKQEPIVVEQAQITTKQTKIITGDKDLLKVKSLPGNYKISPNFTLEMLSSKAAVSSYKIPEVTNKGLKYGEVVYNLHLLALNVLEPILTLYPNMIVTSGFRIDSIAKTSQHLSGQAADIQFKGVAKKEYYDIAKKLAQIITYDQFLLEYAAEARNPWLHISFVETSKGTNRKQCLTLSNHKTYAQGFANLA